MAEPRLIDRARRAYELGRLRRAGRSLALPLTVVALAVLLAPATLPAMIAGAVLVTVTGAAAWYGRAAAIGASASRGGVVAVFVAPLIVRLEGNCQVPMCEGACLLSCVIGGMCGGTWIATVLQLQQTTQLATLIASLIALSGAALGAALNEPPAFAAAGLGLGVGAAVASALVPRQAA